MERISGTVNAPRVEESAANRAFSSDTRSRLEIAALIASAVLVFAVLWIFRYRGWYPHDEGTLGQAAERILRGEIPHRDFDDPYTGGLAYLHALVFRLGGVSANALRDHLVLVASVWLVGVFWLLRQWMRPIGAALVVVLIAVWSVPLYPVAMPSWYVLFFTCAAGAVLVRWPARNYRALLLAGALVGTAALFKVTAVFALAGVGWALVAIRQTEAGDRRGAIEVIAAAMTFAGLVLWLVGSLLDANVLVHVALPPLAIVAGIAWREIRQGRARGFGIDVELSRRTAALVVGAAVPVAIYGAWLASQGALAPLVASFRGVVGERAASAAFAPPTAASIGYAVPLLLAIFATGRWSRAAAFGTAIVGTALGTLAWFHPDLHAHIWDALRGLLPLGAVLFCLTWPWMRVDLHVGSARALPVFASVAGVMTLTQFPFAAPIYFVYVLPLLIVALTAAVSRQPAAAQRPAAVLALLLVLFAITQVIPGAPDSLAVSAEQPARLWLTLPRARLLVPDDEAVRYRALVATLDSLPPGPIWAGPDAPEVAFLSARRDLNRSFFGFLAAGAAPGADFGPGLVARGARAVVIDTAPAFSTGLSQAALESVTRYFPNRRSVDYFEIHWRGARP